MLDPLLSAIAAMDVYTKNFVNPYTTQAWVRDGKTGAELVLPSMVLPNKTAHDVMESKTRYATVLDTANALEEAMLAFTKALCAMPLLKFQGIGMRTVVTFSPGQEPKLGFDGFFTSDRLDEARPDTLLWRSANVIGSRPYWHLSVPSKTRFIAARLNAMAALNPADFRYGPQWVIEHSNMDMGFKRTTWQARSRDLALRAHMLTLEPWMLSAGPLDKPGIRVYRLDDANTRDTLWAEALEGL